MIDSTNVSGYRGPDARYLIEELTRQLELLGNPVACPVRAVSEPRLDKLEVWASHNPYLHINVFFPST